MVLHSCSLQDPKDLKLFREGTELKDSSTLADGKVENGDILAMTFALPEGADSSIPHLSGNFIRVLKYCCESVGQQHH